MHVRCTGFTVYYTSRFESGRKDADSQIDFSRGNQEVIASLTHIAVRMGFSRQKGKEAALAGLTSQKISKTKS